MKNHLPTSMMMWTINDRLIEDLARVDTEVEDIRTAGFEGVVALVRCSRYAWNEEPAQATLQKISSYCRDNGLSFWCGADPRSISHSLVSRGNGLRVVAFGEQTGIAKASPLTSVVKDGKYSVRQLIKPRHVHTMHEAAISYQPLGMAAAFLMRFDERNCVVESIDVSATTRFFFNARDQYVEAFGEHAFESEHEWRFIAFFGYETNHFDFSSHIHLDGYVVQLQKLIAALDICDGIVWDEPGFTCTFGSLPFSVHLQERVREETGISVQSSLWKFAFDDAKGSHVAIRNNFFACVQSSIENAKARSRETINRLLPRTLFGIHDTWHWESADMCDRNHGSLDLWRNQNSKCGFVDLGSLQLLAQKDTSYHANLATMCVVGASLGRRSALHASFNNLWLAHDEHHTDEQHIRSLEHAVHAAAAFGHRWLAHIYGPAGTVGHERSFLDLGFTPGYPEHCTWRIMPTLNEFLRRHFELTEASLPDANILVVFPLETMYSLSNACVNRAASTLFDLMLALVDHHYQVDVVSSALLATARMSSSSVIVNDREYDAVIFPWPSVMRYETMKMIEAVKPRCVFAFEQPSQLVDGAEATRHIDLFAPTIADTLSVLHSLPNTKRVHAPENSWVTTTEMKEGALLTVVPARFGSSFLGEVRFREKSITIRERSLPAHLLFPNDGTPSQLER